MKLTVDLAFENVWLTSTAQCVATVCCNTLQYVAQGCSRLLCVEVCCCVLQMTTDNNGRADI